MANVKKVSYFKMMVPNRPGQGARALSVLHQAGINLVAFSGFPHRGGAQMDFIPAKPSAFRKVARKNKWKIAGPKRAFLVSGADRVGEEIQERLAAIANEYVKDPHATLVVSPDNQSRQDLPRQQGLVRASRPALCSGWSTGA